MKNKILKNNYINESADLELALYRNRVSPELIAILDKCLFIILIDEKLMKYLTFKEVKLVYNYFTNKKDLSFIPKKILNQFTEEFCLIV